MRGEYFFIQPRLLEAKVSDMRTTARAAVESYSARTHSVATTHCQLSAKTLVL